MKKLFQFSVVLLSILLFLTSCSTETEKLGVEKPRYNPPISYQEASAWADSMVALMTLEEKASMIGGTRMFFTEGIPRLDIPGVMFADATQGIHLREEFMGHKYDLNIDSSTAMPCPILLASTWNPDLSGKYAKAIGEECKAAAIPVLLGPGFNMYRVSQCGRNFEYFGEDPYLVSRMIENYVVGLQNTGTIATLKHFVANNTEYHRKKSNSIVDERTLHEIYFPGFKAGIDAGAMAVMTAYNLVNGKWAGQSREVISNYLEDQLGFKWLVMTDWWSVFDGEKTIKSGQDLEMPSSDATANAEQLVKEGKVAEEDLNSMVHSLLKTLYAMDAFNREAKPDLIKKFPEHEKTALEVAREGVVLLRNENNILPIEEFTQNILLTGPYADKVATGGGAAYVEGYNKIPLNEALAQEFGNKLEYIKEASDSEIKNADIVLLSVGTRDHEAWDRPFALPDSVNDLVDKISSLNKNTVVIVNSGSGIKMTHWNNKVAAILYAWYPGQIGNVATAEIISGKVNPSGKLPMTIEKKFSDSPGYGYLPEGAEFYEGWEAASSEDQEIYDIVYDEGVLVGYRWYDTKNIEPLYPFGHGLSYTNFAYCDLSVADTVFSTGEPLEVKCTIRNIGQREGLETIQLYVSDLESSLDRPEKELKAFKKVKVIPGDSLSVDLVLTEEDFSFYDPEKNSWIAEPGKFKISVGSSSADIRQTAIVTMQ